MDPFDLFEMFFSGMGNNARFERGGRVFRQPQHQHQHEENPDGQQRQRGNQGAVRLMQLLPFLALLLFSVIPYLFSSV